MLEEQLEKFGLSEKEAKTYVSLLQLGEATVNEVATESGVNRSSAYVVLEALQKKRLVSATQDGGVQKFQPADPDKLVLLAEEQLKEQLAISQRIKELLPSLKGVHSANKHRPKIRVLEGAEGLTQAFEDTLECTEKRLRVISSVSEISKLLPKTYFPAYVRRRIKNGISMIGIHPDTKFTKLIHKLIPESSGETMLIPEKDFHFPADLTIYDDKIGYMTHKSGGYAVEITDQHMADTMKGVFDLAYKQAQIISEGEKPLPK